MKRIKLMLSAILLVAAVAAALAFKIKTTTFCAYYAQITNGGASATCPRVDANCVASLSSIIVGSEHYVGMRSCPTIGACPESLECFPNRTLVDE